MTKRTVTTKRTRSKKAVENPEIRRAVERMNGTTEPDESAPKTEIELLRALVQTAAWCFETGDDTGPNDAARVLREAIRAAKDDLGIISFASNAGGGAYNTSFMMLRLEHQLDLALSLYEIQARDAAGAQ